MSAPRDPGSGGDSQRDQLTADKGALVIELEATRRRAADDEARVELLLQA